VTRSIAIVPGIIIAAAEGRNGLGAALNSCNVVLSVALIFFTFPLVCYTSFDRYMRVETEGGAITLAIETLDAGQDAERVGQRNPTVSLKNNLLTASSELAICYFGISWVGDRR
jgi:metal iron transporter